MVAQEDDDDDDCEDDCEDLFCFPSIPVGAIVAIPAASFIVGGLVLVGRGVRLRTLGRAARELHVGIGLTSARLRLSF